MKTKPMSDDLRVRLILIGAQPRRSGAHSKLRPDLKAGLRGLLQTPPGQKRDKKKDYWEAESNWHRNLAFLGGVYALIPTDETVLKHDAEKLLVRMFGKGIPNNRPDRFNTAERRRIRKDGDAAWRLVRRLRRHFGLPD